MAGKEPLGHVFLALTDLPELQDVSVRSVYRRRGIATALTRAAEHEARGLGFDPMRLSVIDGNEPACEIILPLSVACRASVPPP